MPNAAGTLAHELYETGLGREVEPTGLQAFKAAYASVSPAQLAAALVDSAEFIAIHLGQDNATYVDSLYQAGLGRHAEAPGLVSWTRQLDSGQLSRADVLLGVATSAESGLHWTHGLSV